MCGVFGYVGQPIDVGAVVVAALKRLEYRGYDSWGVAVAVGGGLALEKHVGRINGHMRRFPEATVGLGHTRWATHGGVTPQNAHPHACCENRIAVVHNGIIENHAALKRMLVAEGHAFRSDTDSEVAAHLVERGLSQGRSFTEAVAATFAQLEGHNAIVVLDAARHELAAMKRMSPLVVGLGVDSQTIASDAFALDGYADRLVFLEDDQLALLGPTSSAFFDGPSLRPRSAATVPATPSGSDGDLGEHPDYLSKEVAEQPIVLRRLAACGLDEIALLAAQMQAARRVAIIGCGSAGNAALAGSYLLDQVCGLEAPFIPASEFLYRNKSIGAGDLVVALSQSGETLDVLAAVKAARDRGARVAAIVNTPHSTLARMADLTVALRAGVEQCVLATKSYTAMVAALFMLSYDLAGERDAGEAGVRSAARAIEALLLPPSRQRIADIGRRLAARDHLFVVGRGVHYPSALEAALKIKEVSYIHAEGFAAGELKHGVIALVEPGTPCLVLAAADETRSDLLSNAHELRSRGAHVIGIGPRNDEAFDDFISTPDVGPASPIVEAVPGQLLGYAAALCRGHDPDRPRNLAKSVTVK